MTRAPVETLVAHTLHREARSLNTDWDGSLVIAGLLDWGALTGDKRCLEFGMRWFADHAAHDATMSDERFYQTYIGIRSRIIRSGPLVFTAYCGHWGLAYPCQRLAGTTTDDRPAAAVVAVADFLLHQAARSPHGCLYHDDHADFLIPDTCYFAAPVLAIAGQLTGADVYVEQAARQLSAYLELMQDQQTGLAFTLWSAAEMSRTFWSRATGWLAGAIVNTLAHLPGTHACRNSMTDAFRRLATGWVHHQRDDGGFHILLDRPDLPTETTGAAMAAYALSRGIRLGILGPEFQSPAVAAWRWAESHITPAGTITDCYTGWAKTAVAGNFSQPLFAERDFSTGLILLAAAQSADAALPHPAAGTAQSLSVNLG